MYLTDEDVESLVRDIWAAVLGLPVTAVPSVVEGPSHAAVIHVHGSWEGTVVLHAASDLAAAVAGAMFACDPAELSEEEIADALGEVVNMLGGSVKAVVDGPASLSLPTVIAGAEMVTLPGSTTLNAVSLASGHLPLSVHVLQRADARVELRPVGV